MNGSPLLKPLYCCVYCCVYGSFTIFRPDLHTTTFEVPCVSVFLRFLGETLWNVVVWTGPYWLFDAVTILLPPLCKVVSKRLLDARKPRQWGYSSQGAWKRLTLVIIYTLHFTVCVTKRGAFLNHNVQHIQHDFVWQQHQGIRAEQVLVLTDTDWPTWRMKTKKAALKRKYLSRSCCVKV